MPIQETHQALIRDNDVCVLQPPFPPLLLPFAPPCFGVQVFSLVVQRHCLHKRRPIYGFWFRVQGSGFRVQNHDPLPDQTSVVA